MKKSYLPRKDSIILTAIEIIDELGIHELSIRELAGRQGVSEPAIYRHFKSKQDILLAVLDYYAYFDVMIAKTIQERELTSKESILFLVKAFSEYYENYPALTAITFAYGSVLRYDPVIAQKADAILEGRSKFLIDLVEKGQKQGEIIQDFNSQDLSDTVMGLLNAVILRWRVCNYGFSLKDRIMNATQTLLNLC